jgi:hypothetical protein
MPVFKRCVTQKSRGILEFLGGIAQLGERLNGIQESVSWLCDTNTENPKPFGISRFQGDFFIFIHSLNTTNRK